MDNPTEKGIVTKHWKNSVKIALVYPNSYSVGMSSLAFQTIYSLINENTFITIERFFNSANDSRPLSIESKKPLHEFDIVFFSVSYSTDFLNVFDIIKKSGINLRSKDRKHHKPLIAGGGTALTINPEPISLLFDFIFLGEAENFIKYFCDLLSSNPQIVNYKSEILNKIRYQPGVYIPADLDIVSDNEKIKAFGHKFKDCYIKRVIIKDINKFSTHSTIFSSHAEFGTIFMDEISRGCARGCRFCAIGFISRPYRKREYENLGFKAKNISKYKVGLLGAALSDHPQITKIINNILDCDTDLSLSSFRIDRLDKKMIDLLEKSNIKTLTVAPEVGTEKMMKVVSKKLSIEKMVQSLKLLANSPIKTLKLYFMVGLPFENQSDIEGIVSLAKELNNDLNNLSIKLSINPFIPKPFTPFQWCKVADKKYIKKTYTYIKKNLSPFKIKVETAPLNEIFLDALLSRGDRKLCEKMIQSYEYHSNPKEVLEKSLKTPFSEYLGTIDTKSVLPWDFIDGVVKKEFLLKEFMAAKSDALKYSDHPL